MPAIDTVRNTNVRPKAKKRSGGASASKPKPKPKPKPKVYTLPKTFRTEGNVSQGHKQTQHESEAVQHNVREAQKKIAQRPAQVQRKAQEKFGVKGQRAAQEKVIKDFAALHASDPEKYESRLREHKRGLIEKIANKGQSALTKAGEEFKHALPSYHTGSEYDSKGRRTAKAASVPIGFSRAVKETSDIVATTPTSVYMTADAIKQAAGGNTKPAKRLWKDFKDTSALPELAQGHIAEAYKRAKNRPVSTALELSGARAVLGRGAGAAMRTGALGSKAKAAASTARAPQRLYKGTQEGEGPAVGRRYSKDVFEKAAQKVKERHAERQGRDPNEYHEATTPLMSGRSARAVPNVGPGKHPLDDRVDRHVHAFHVAKTQIIRDAEKKARKRGHAKEPIKDDPSPTQLAKEHTRQNPRVQHLDPEHVAHHAHDVLGIKKPVVVRLMPQRRREALAKTLGKEPRGYAEDLGTHYRIEINPKHPGNNGPKGASNVAHYELGRVQAMDRGLDGPGEVGSADRKAYFENANTAHAQETLRRHVGTDLRQPPIQLPEREFTGTPRPTTLDEASQRAAQAAQQSHLRRVVRDISVPIGPRGYVSTHAEAQEAAIAASARTGERMVPVNAGRLTRMSKEPIRPRSADPHGLRLATSYEKAWKDAVHLKQPGKWVLMPERAVERFVKHAENSRNYGALQRTTNLFKDVVLTTSNPVRWLGGNVTDLGMRSINEGLTPVDLYRGARVYRELSRHGRQGRMVQASTMGGGFGHMARDVTGELSPPGVSHVAKIWHRYRSGVYGIESAIESLPQMATVGKELRTGKYADPRSGLKGLLRATDEQIQHFAREMVVDPATELRVAHHVEDVIGKWGKLSPEARRALAVAPFAQWLGAATKYVLVTLPVKHPIKTGIAAGLSQMTEKERQALGFSNMIPLDKQAQDYQMMTLPQHVGKDKYGPVVKGTDLARALSMGTVNDALGLNIGGYLFPQFSGALAAANGSSWTGEPLKYPEGHKNAGMELSVEDRRKTAIGMLIEAMVPGAAAYRRVFQEKGLPSLPQSTVLDPQVRMKYNPKTKKLEKPKGTTTTGLKKLTGSPIPGLPQEKRVYTKGAVNQIERSRTAIQEVKKWNAERSGKAKGPVDPYTGRALSAPTPTPTPTDIDPYTGKARKK